MEQPPKELQAYWESVLRKEGLAMSRGRRVLKNARTLMDLDMKVCSQCQGYHTLEDDCAFRPQA